MEDALKQSTLLSIVIPCYNEEATLESCVKTVLAIADAALRLEIIIVDDASKDKSGLIGQELAQRHPEITYLRHERNQGKGAALRTGFQRATGDFVAVQDADLEYDPQDLKQLLGPLISGRADVVFGSRFLSAGAHRVLYFWHSLGNRFLTFISNMFTDLSLTDMETCYKVFRREVIQAVTIEENRFGFEPEIVAKVAHMRLRIYEMGVSYYGRTYAEGKKIGVRDGFRALWCIFYYNAYQMPLPLQFLVYLFIGGVSAGVNLLSFHLAYRGGMTLAWAVGVAFVLAAVVNYLLCILLLFRHKARWSALGEQVAFWLFAGFIALVDQFITHSLVSMGMEPLSAKFVGAVGLVLVNFLGRRYLVFPSPGSKPWQ
ncbi:MAG: bifunctional glycosyltransferase family 2/GtrA family protein [Magnetococcales bacterium]|nr:bifunctional glycosyltransferase family 2/GtrA family protein [Magnetococcales bacterium]